MNAELHEVYPTSFDLFYSLIFSPISVVGFLSGRMKYIETDFNFITILDDNTVLVEAKDNVEIDLEKAQYANQLIQDEMSDNYGMIISRKADYSIRPHEVYDVLNNIENLKAIALIACEKNFLPINMEKRFYQNKIEAFETMHEAHKWVTSVLMK